MAETDLDSVVATIEAERPDACVIDSVQVLYDPALTGSAGSVGQVREVAGRLMRVAKERGTAVLLVGHVTKEGAIAGPRVLEHLVDCVLSFEGERERSYRTLRALKNRFGSTNEVGVFEMRDSGLVEVEDASARFVAEATHAPGSVVLCAMEGSRPLLVEVQALVAPERAGAAAPRGQRRGPQPAGADPGRAGPPRRGAPRRQRRVRVDRRRRARGGAGRRPGDRPGARLRGERGATEAPGQPPAAFGELGLTGELRQAAHADRRLAEARKFGLTNVLHPSPGLTTLSAALTGQPRSTGSVRATTR